MRAKIKVLIVDDSASVRAALSKGLEADPRFTVAGAARDGLDAIARVKELEPDVITMDVEMPKMDGVRALEQIMQECPTPVVMVSSLTRRGAQVTLRALELGAVDFVLKANSYGTVAVSGVLKELAEKICIAASANVRTLVVDGKKRARRLVVDDTLAGGGKATAVIIASSTGGPQALRGVIPLLPATLPVPVIVVQHLPATFTGQMADGLNKISEVTVEEARPGVKLKAGNVLIAPGGVHMNVTKAGHARFNLDEPECGVRPSANPTMESLAELYGSATLGVVLTGMGADGTRGAGVIKKAGGRIIAQDEDTCVVYGMPKSVVEAGYVDRILPLEEIAAEIVRCCSDTARTEEIAV